MSRRIVTVLSVLMLTLAVGVQRPTAVVGVGSGGVALTATLDGRPIPATDAGQFYCHDFEYPMIRCYSSAVRLEEAVSTSGPDGVALAASGVLYMTIYDYASFAGGYAYLSQDYDGLWAIGWNDRISSFRVHNSQSGKLYTEWYRSGGVLPFCCNSQVTMLTSTFDNTISSVYRF